MTQATIAIANGSGAAVRAAVNSALEAITTKQSGGTAPSTTYPFMEWADTANDLLKQRNAANSAWIIKGTLSAEYGGLPASGISYAPGSPALVDAANVQDAIDVMAAQINAIPFTELTPFGPYAITNANTITVAHGLGAVPKLVWVTLRCKTADLGYAVGDEVDLTTYASVTPTLSSSGYATAKNATNVIVQIGINGIAIVQRSATVGNAVAITNGSWELIINVAN